ncbi:LuxR C-terminal-related transcriptional regulator [Mycolicibacterium sp. lyk4-40-TYG-92]|uniref:LuxR C-terminal-related transcriptional regulator n=1 Tax=Mycolicibacterium sp. lyk4-40-TYG-92 TaxID=3040295 RepID=UPI00254BAD69|nr:LuxR C-terminal-related transcriptional regulator [Mycolicibacterium sp. lyk4-40-TYG-92]
MTELKVPTTSTNAQRDDSNDTYQQRTRHACDDSLPQTDSSEIKLSASLRASTPTRDDVRLQRQLDCLNHRFSQQRTLASGATEDLLATVQRLRRELSDHRAALEFGELTRIRDAVNSLRGASPRETFKMAAAMLCRDFGFARVLVSTIQDHEWLPRYLHVRGIGESRSQTFHGFSVGVPVALATSGPEADVVRSRRGMLVPGPAVSNCHDYMVAPITLGGKVIGMLHAQSPQPAGITAEGRLASLEAFAECLAAVYECAVLDGMVERQRLEVDKLSATVDQLLGRITRDEISEFPTSSPDSGIPCMSDHAAPSELTAREREVMSHVATGATNRDIARCLSISEATVKSHLKHIAEKFNTTNRAAALAMYLTAEIDSGAGVPR